MKTPLFIFLWLAAIFFIPISSYSWGKEGHQLVAQIAWYDLDAAMQKKLLSYLPGMTIDEAATWMDDVRSDAKFDYMKPWHYINIEKGKVYKQTDKPNIVNELNKVITELQNRKKLNKQQIKTDIAILMHLVGDLHQPLHVGYGADQGGNTIIVRYNSTSKNLHQMWDSQIITSAHISLTTCLSLVKGYTAQQKLTIKKGTVTDWMSQSRALLDSAYAFTNNTIDQNYINRNSPIVKKQLVYAGLRLSSLLQKALKD